MIYTPNGGLMFRPHVTRAQLFQSVQYGVLPQTAKGNLKKYRSIQNTNMKQSENNINSIPDKSISLISLKEESQLDDESFLYIQKLIYDDQRKVHTNKKGIISEVSRNINSRQMLMRNTRPKTTTFSTTFHTIATSVSRTNLNIPKPPNSLIGFRVDGIGCGKTTQSRSDWFNSGVQQKTSSTTHHLSQNFIVRKQKPLKNTASQFNL